MNKDILVTGKNGFIGKALDGGRDFCGRVENFRELFLASKNIQGIVHLAAASHRKKCAQDPIACIRTNLLGVANVLELAKVQKAWVLFISTFQVREQGLYGISKLMGEELCRTYQAKGVNVRIIRLPIVYGHNDAYDKVVMRVIRQMKEGKQVTCSNDEHYFAYVDDVARMIESEVDIMSGGIGTKHSFRDLKEGIKEVLSTNKGENND